MFWGIARILIATETLLWQFYWTPRAIRSNHGLARTGLVGIMVGIAMWACAVMYDGAEWINPSLVHDVTIHDFIGISKALGILIMSIGIYASLVAGKRERSRSIAAKTQPETGDTPHADT